MQEFFADGAKKGHRLGTSLVIVGGISCPSSSKGRGGKSILQQEKRKQPIRVAFFFLCCAALIDATTEKSIKSRSLDFGDCFKCILNRCQTIKTILNTDVLVFQSAVKQIYQTKFLFYFHNYLNYHN